MSLKNHRTKLVIAAVLAACSLLATGCNKAKTNQLDSGMDSLSWILGRNTAESLTSGPFKDINPEIFVEAVRATFACEEQPINDSTYHAVLQQVMMVAQRQAMQQTSDREQIVNQQQEEYFARLVKENPNVKKHPAGFYYEVLKPGKGPNAYYAAHVYFDYRSYTMFDGEPYDQTYGKREPISTVVGNPMFPGLIEAFQVMNAGSIYRFYFPYQLAFGGQGSGSIPGFTPFIYEIELHKFSGL